MPKPKPSEWTADNIAALYAFARNNGYVRDQADFAAALGVGRVQISLWTHNRQAPGNRSVRALRDFASRVGYRGPGTAPNGPGSKAVDDAYFTCPPMDPDC